MSFDYGRSSSGVTTVVTPRSTPETRPCHLSPFSAGFKGSTSSSSSINPLSAARSGNDCSRISPRNHLDLDAVKERIREHYNSQDFSYQGHPLVLEGVAFSTFQTLIEEFGHLLRSKVSFSEAISTLTVDSMALKPHESAITPFDVQYERMVKRLVADKALLEGIKLRLEFFRSESLLLYDRRGRKVTVEGRQPDSAHKVYIEDLNVDSVPTDPSDITTIRRGELPATLLEVGVSQKSDELHTKLSDYLSLFLRPEPTSSQRLRCVFAIDIVEHPSKDDIDSTSSAAMASSRSPGGSGEIVGSKRKASGPPKARTTGSNSSFTACFYAMVRTNRKTNRNISEQNNIKVLAFRQLLPPESDAPPYVEIPAQCFVPRSYLREDKSDYMVRFDVGPLENTVKVALDDLLERRRNGGKPVYPVSNEASESDYDLDWGDDTEIFERAAKKMKTFYEGEN